MKELASRDAGLPRRLALWSLAAMMVTSVSVGSVAKDLDHRTLILFARGANDASLRAQVAMLGQAADGLAERDVVVEKLLSNDPRYAPLRRKFHMTGGFHVLLIGKDGNVAEASDQPITSRRLFGIIDAMPMRQAEMRHAHSP